MSTVKLPAITLWQPYLAGVLCGDGWCTRHSIGLRCADAEFADAFSASLRAGMGVSVDPRLDERGYWLVRSGNGSGRFDGLDLYEPDSHAEIGAWLRGYFDSEGNAQLIHQPQVSPRAFWRRVSFYSTDRPLLARAVNFLDRLELPSAPMRVMKNTEGHMGSRPVYEIRIRHSRERFARFARLVGSSITRKSATLEAIVDSYQPPGHHARAQAKSAAARRSRRDAGGKY